MKLHFTIVRFILLALAIFSSVQLQSQVNLTTSPYTESFDGVGSGYPTGWTGRTGANATNLGTTQTLTTSKTAWNNTTGAFKNFASADGLNSGSSTTDQSNSTDRALGVRQTGSFGDPGASFTLQLANTNNITNLQLSFKLQSLDISSPRIVTWKLQYALGSSPAAFTDVTTSPGTMTTGGSSFTNTSITATLPAAVENQNQEVWLRVVTLSAATGSGNRPSTGIDDFQMTFDQNTGVQATRLVISGAPTAQEVNQPFSITICAEDDNGNVQTDYSQPIALTQLVGTAAIIAPASPQVPMGGCVSYTITPTAAPDVINFEASSGSLISDSTGQIVVYNPLSTCYTDVNCGFTIAMTQSNGENDQWSCNNSVYAINGYCANCPQANTEGWLISPKFDLSTSLQRHFDFHVTKSFTGPALEIFYTTNYTGDPNTTTWISLDTANGSGNKSLDVTALTGMNIQFGIKYTADGSSGGSASYSVNNISLKSDDCANTELLSCNITDLIQWNINGCDNKGTSNTLDDTYGANVTVYFGNKPTTGNLRIYANGSLKQSIDVTTLDVDSTSYTFTNLSLPANNQAFSLKANFSADTLCTYQESFPARTSCSPAAGIAFNPGLATSYYVGDTTTVQVCFVDDNNIPSPQSFYPVLALDISPALGEVISGPDGTGPCFTFTILPTDTGVVSLTAYDENFNFVASDNTKFTERPCVFISEIVDPTSGNNKYLEVYNGSNFPVDISSYNLKIYANGHTSPDYTLAVNPGTILQPTETYVFKNTAAGQDFTGCDGHTTTSNNYNTNGDDAYEWVEGSYIHDMYGIVGEMPANNTSWNYNDKVVKRKSSIYCGNSNFTLSEWDMTSYTVNNTGDPCNHCVTPLALAESDTLCAGDTLHLSGKGGETYAWTGPNGFSSNALAPTIDGVTELNKGWYVMTITVAGSCTDLVDSVYIEVKGVPMAEATAIPASICVGGTVNLSATGGDSYSWTGPDGFSSNLQNPTLTNVSELNEGNYIVTVFNSCNLFASDTVFVEVIDALVLNSQATPNPACEGDSLFLTAEGSGNFNWAGPNGFSSNLQNPVLSDIDESNSGDYVVTLMDNNGCSAADTITVLVKPAPNFEADIYPNPICEGDTLFLNANTGADSVLWTAVNGWTSNNSEEIIPDITSDYSGDLLLQVTQDGCSSSYIFELDVLDKPTLELTAENNPACEGGIVTIIGNSDGDINWTGSNNFTFQGDTIILSNITSSEAGMYYAFVSNENECFAYDSILVIVNPEPNVTAFASPNPVCQGSNLFLYGSSQYQGSYSWTGPNGFSSNEQNPIIPNIQILNSGQYIVRLVAGIGCEAFDTVTVLVNSAPAPTASATPNPVCVGGTLQLSATGTGTFSWTGPDGFASNQQTPIILDMSLAKAGDYIVTLEATNGCIGKDTVSVIVNFASPTIASATPNPVCAGGTVQLSATGTGSFSWTGPLGYISNLQNPSIVNITLAQAGEYIVTFQTTEGCLSSDTVTVVVNESSPTIASATPNPVCSGGTVQLSASGSGTFSWSGPGGYTSNLQNPSIPNMTLAQAGNYIVTIQNTSGCLSKDTVTVMVNFAPPPIASATPNPVCTGGTVQLSAIGTGTFSWAGPLGYTSNLQNPSISNISLAQEGNYIVTLQTTAGCLSKDTVYVDVNQAPGINVGATPNPICVGNNLTLSASGGIAYKWTGPLGFTSNNQNPVRHISSVAMGGTYSVTVTTSGGCTASGTVFVNVLPEVNGTAWAEAEEICLGSALKLHATGGGTYAWSGPNNFSSTVQNPVVLNFSIEKIGVYQVIITNSGGCSATYLVKVGYLAPPVATASYEQSSACAGSTLQLHGGGRGSYLWSGPNSFTSSEQDPTIPNVSVNQSGLYTLIVTGLNGCADTTTLQVDVKPLPFISIPGGPLVVCEGDGVYLTAKAQGDVSWSGPYGYFTEVDNPYVNNIPIYMSGYYVATVVGATGCVNSDSVLVKVFPSVVATAYAEEIYMCEGGTIRIHASGGTFYQWTGPGGYHSNEQNPVIINITEENAGTYQVLVYNEAGCFGTAYVNIYVNPLVVKPFIYATPNPAGVGQTVQFYATGGLYYKWSGPLGFESDQRNPILPNVSLQHGGVYYCQIIDSSSCQVTVSTLLRVFGKKQNILSSEVGQGSIYPNPTKNELIFNGVDGTSVEYTIYSAVGSVITSGKTKDFRLEISNLKNGLYYIVWKTDTGNEYYKNGFIKIE
ncbi:MAG TPA: lamin tail domain-containing protein [Saprospiraceae bacterium]|nr:lamin tail domain-containing protein [Saprospiraceae bacterium]